jgi:hypothetical protein
MNKYKVFKTVVEIKYKKNFLILSNYNLHLAIDIYRILSAFRRKLLFSYFRRQSFIIAVVINVRSTTVGL